MEKRASILLEALPYIQRFHGKTLVIKLGGSLIGDPNLIDSVCQDVVMLNFVGMKIVLVHGGGPEVSGEMERAGLKPKFVDGMRFTDDETMEIIHKSLVGKVNKSLVLGISRHGGNVVGTSGIDGGLIRAKKVPKLGLVGKVEKVNPSVIEYLLNNGYIPVIAPLGVSSDGSSLNLNADAVAGELAAAMKAEKIILLTDVPGVLRDPKKRESLISTLTVKKAVDMKKSGKIKDGMIPKIDACIKAVKSGVKRAHIIEGTTEHSLLLEVLTQGGIGTMIERGPK